MRDKPFYIMGVPQYAHCADVVDYLKSNIYEWDRTSESSASGVNC
jgi:hypothetical protein